MRIRIMGLIILALLGTIGYFVKCKLFKGDKNISKREIIIGCIFTAYIILVFGVTFLNRGYNNHRGINIHFLSSYREAWNTFSLRNWQYIILNIFMFVPFGFLFPFLKKRFHNICNTLMAALLFTICIELLQFATGLGIFDIDDIFNNFLGAFIGYGIIMAFQLISKSDHSKGLKVIGSLLPLFITLLFFISLFAYYENKELGNMPQAHNYTIDLKNADITINASPKDSRDIVPMYRVHTYTKDETIKWANEFFDDIGIDETEIEMEFYNDYVVFWRRGEPTYNIRFNYLGGSYQFIDYSRSEVGKEPMNIQESILLDSLSVFGIIIPEGAAFTSEDKGSYQWKVDKNMEEENLFKGTIYCTYFNDHTVKELYNGLITYEKIRDVTIISEKKALEELTSGKFQYHDDNIKEIIIENITIKYILDTKGFYQPVYSFQSVIDGSEYSIIVPAIE